MIGQMAIVTALAGAGLKRRNELYSAEQLFQGYICYSKNNYIGNKNGFPEALFILGIAIPGILLLL